MRIRFWGAGALLLLGCGDDAVSHRDAPTDAGLADTALADAVPDATPPLVDFGTGPDSPYAALPAGCFTMGSPTLTGSQPQHEVCVGAFALGKAEVTNGEYAACVAAGACTPAHFDDGGCYAWDGEMWRLGAVEAALRAPDHPAVCVDWQQAADYAAHVGGRLPTESEWEYAAQSGGQGTIYPWGDTPPDCTLAVFSSVDGRCEASGTTPPCSRPDGRTQQNVCDLAGNVWEWVADTFHATYDGHPVDGSARAEPGVEQRVVRGGGWPIRNADYLRTRYRDDEPAVFAYDFLGFRVAR
jgi:formylglycine-generating enzyme required for sulfatase activity